MFEFGLTSSRIIWLLAAIFIIYSVFSLIRSFSSDFYSPKHKILLLVLRVIVFFIFIILFLDLKIEHQSFKKNEAEIAFLWDASESISSQEDYKIDNILRSGFYKDLEKHLAIIHVQNMIKPVYIAPQKLKRLNLNEKISDNSALLRFAEKEARFSELFLVSDGQSYFGEDLEYYRSKNNLKIHVIGIGEKNTEVLPLIRSLRYPDYIAQGDTVSVKYEVHNPGKNKQDLKLALYVDGKVLEEKISLDAYRSQNIQNDIEFSAEGLHEFEWRLITDKKETKLWSQQVFVHPSKLNIVFFADPPHRDVSMVKYILDDQDRYESYHYKDWEEKFPEKSPDILVQSWHPQLERKRYNNTPALLFYRDRQGEYINSSPLKILDYKAYVYVNPDPRENARYWTQLPPVQMAESSLDGKVILGDEKGHALILENGNDVIVNASGMWVWNLASYQKDWDGLYFHLMEGIIKSLIGKNADKLVKLDQEKYSMMAYWPLAFSVDIVEDLEDYELRITLLDSTYGEVKRIERAKANETFYFKHDDWGNYFIKAELYIKDELLASDTSDVQIIQNDIETSQLGLNESVLKKLAKNNGGEYYHYRELDSLKHKIEIKEKTLLVSKYFEARSAYLLYLIMFLALCADWIIRKRNGGV
ncbi:MAG: hypothetical protein WCT23_05835 [Candidatus Neomarinimicrobiota bacterium]